MSDATIPVGRFAPVSDTRDYDNNPAVVRLVSTSFSKAMASSAKGPTVPVPGR